MLFWHHLPFSELQDTTSGRHLLELVSTYYVLIKVKTGATDDFKLELAAHIEQMNTNGTNPAWCGTFCTVHASDIVETGGVVCLGISISACFNFVCHQAFCAWPVPQGFTA